MPDASQPVLLRVPMSWEDYLALPDKPKAEWVAGEAVIMNAPPPWSHSDALVRLGSVLVHAGPDLLVATDTSVRLPDDRVRRPDITVVAEVPTDGWVTEAPLMVAEVLSRSTRSEDLIRKSVEYQKAGIGQYWVVDPELRTFEVMVNEGSCWRTTLLLDDEHPEGTAEVDCVTISLDLREVLRA